MTPITAVERVLAAGGERYVPEPDGERWHLLRAGIHNVWEYDDHRFVFHRGRLLLRGRNESGKTKALEVLLPFLLDADLAPQRLDPFGSTSRPMRWNLINEHNPTVKIAVGYVWLELGRHDGDRAETLTIGAGLRATRSTTDVTSWYFVTDRRVDRDLHLLDERRVPLSRRRLEEALGDRGRVFERKADYRRAVNAQLFRMPGDQYDALVEALLQLRRPQLSKQLQPAELSRILTASLPPLDDRVIAPLAEGFERLDRHRAERDALDASRRSVQGLLDVYRRYAAVIVKRRALGVTRADSAYQKARATRRQCIEERDELARHIDDLARAMAELETEDDELEAAIRAIRTSDEYRAVQELAEAEREERARADDAEERRRQLERADAASQRAAAEADGARARLAEHERELGRTAAAATDRAADAALAGEHRAVDACAEAGDVPGARGAVGGVLRTREEGIAAVRAEVARVREARAREHRASDRATDAAGRARRADERFAEAEGAAREAHATFVESLEAWLGEVRELAIEPTEAEQSLEAPADEARGRLEPAVERTREAIDADRRAADASLERVLVDIERTREERDALASARHQPPPRPAWRPERPADRPGAPLYLLCEFAPGVGDGRAAGLEAALEASGLLDAWVTPSGEVLGPDERDLALVATPRGGRTLAAVLSATPAGGVAAETIRRVLATVALVEAGAAGPADASWVSADGRFRLGPLAGRHGKPAAEYVGETARERARRARLAELEAELVALAEVRDQAEKSVQATRDRKRTLDRELERFPSHRPVLEARAAVDTAAAVLAEARAEADDADRALEQARAEVARRGAACDEVAAARGLSAWVDALDELRERTHAYRVAVHELVAAAHAVTSERRTVAAQDRRAREVAEHRDEVSREREVAVRRARRAAARAEALRRAAGATRDELLDRLGRAERRRDEVRAALARSRQQRIEAERGLGEARERERRASDDVDTADEQRRAEDEAFRRLLRIDLAAVVGVELDGDPASWSFSDTLRSARRVDAATASVDASQEAGDRAENAAVRRYNDVIRELPAEIRMLPRHENGVLVYETTFNERALGLPELATHLAEEVRSRDELLGEEERDLFESFLSGETHEHLRAQLRRAHELVDRMNRQIEARPTASGTRIRLRWRVDTGAPAGTAEAIDLMLRSSHLLARADRRALQRFLQARLDEARAADGHGTLHERMLGVLDYRGWFAFVIEFRPDGGQWRQLTRKAHGAGSGGQKAVMLHLPLFAAAAAFYESADARAPRLVVLDEAFAGIDPALRAGLMGLLGEFDLDFVMTSFEEWGFYEELDGLSTYHLQREPGLPGVHADWFVWDGRRAHEMGAA